MSKSIKRLPWKFLFDPTTPNIWPIWSSRISIKDYQEWLKEYYPKITDPEEQYNLAAENNADALEILREELDIQLPGPILVLAELGLWHGKRPAYHWITSGNIKDCFYDNNDDVAWFLDCRGDLRCNSFHHDGKNRYLYRTLKEDLNETQKANLERKLSDNVMEDGIIWSAATRQDLSYYTRCVGDWIAEAYGWDTPGVRQKKRKEAARVKNRHI